MNREEIKQVFFENIDLIQSRINKSIEPLNEKIVKLEQEIKTLKEILKENED